ncbi:4Fe-4S dicluster domain-containing protein [Dehalobacter restrictus]|uniref:4Fe-4S dicluster domain-containing protein n=1 Tax=Dehalobacter restrictus TaxID=55583 RepID=A0A857DD73_9FIRM|nr:4Fe-4S dicluster domain-containing protein [Dehalobacter restrictus]QGZ99179.1 4Fe-4S dicluster domain-containing protein [Dehalobacter restrictus]
MTTERIFFSPEDCIQCHGCEVACKSWRNVELGVKWRRIERIWLGQYPEIKSTSASIACRHCDDPACMHACPAGSIEKEASKGVVLVNREKCTGCRVCLEACPYSVPQFGIDGRMQKCDLCFSEIEHSLSVPPCVATCPTNALRFS